ncbi:hypothetical protein [Brevibacillus sp. NRS-1366]|uniref:hypothetical protein n=1 Tax=Brevibacillus sp. NRS-1366 TaxID=3233899 RepID=UPI003D1C6ED9
MGREVPTPPLSFFMGLRHLITFIGKSFYGNSYFRSPTSSIRKINNLQVANYIADELHVRERTDIDQSNMRETWQSDTRLLAKFKNSLEAGNVENGGLQIVEFAIKRRRIDEINSITLGRTDFIHNVNINWVDVTQPNDKFVYSIVPVGENGLEGFPNEVSAESNFVGWWIVDKDNNEVLAFDKAIGNVGNVDTQLNQGRTLIETFSPYPQIYYNNQEYTSFSLTTVIIPKEFERSGKEYKRVFQNFIQKHTPMIVKSGDGRVFVCDVSNLRTSQPLNVWNGHDYLTITVDLVEVEDYETYISENR